jgi:predicted DsbA family dithiol-disulfide isomerase
VLAAIAGEIGLDRNAVMAFLNSDEDADHVRALEHIAQARGVRGVPLFDIDGVVVSRAQPADTIRQTILDAARRVAADIA